ncbi:MAG: hypothetical protein S4CHLAM7_00220 [Chlamydiae bacterium]|nr:hypothetical protein [Chlamydiota bacterium]
MKPKGGDSMRSSKKNSDSQHKLPHSAKKKPVKKEYKLDAPIRSNPNEADWQIEQKALKKRHRDQIR